MAAAKTPTKARNNPVNRPKRGDHSGDIVLPDDQVHTMKAVIEGDIQALRTNGTDIKKFIADEAFMNELCQIEVSEAQTDRDPSHAVVVVNNREFRIPRGVPVWVRRYVVEALAHARQANFKQRRTFIGDTHHMETKETNHLSYPHVLLEDPSGTKGREWWRRVCNDPN